MKKLTLLIIILSSSLFALSYAETFGAELTLDNTPAQVYFSPGGGCTKGIIKEIEAATREILVQAYSFTSTPIKNALVNAQKRGVSVEILLDKGEQKNQKFRTASAFSKNRVPVYVDEKHSNAHNKVMIIDRETVITGSFNFTYAAESNNAENVLINEPPCCKQQGIRGKRPVLKEPCFTL